MTEETGSRSSAASRVRSMSHARSGACSKRQPSSGVSERGSWPALSRPKKRRRSSLCVAVVFVAGLWAVAGGGASAASGANTCTMYGITKHVAQSTFGSTAEALAEVQTPSAGAPAGTSGVPYCKIEVSTTLSVTVELYPVGQASVLYAGYENGRPTKEPLSGLGTGAVFLRSGKTATVEDLVLFTAGPDFVAINGLAATEAATLTDLIALAHAIYPTLSTSSATPTTTNPSATTTTPTTATSTTPTSTAAKSTPTPAVHYTLIASKLETGPKVAVIGGRVKNPTGFEVKINATPSVVSQVNYSLDCYENGGEQISSLGTSKLQRTPFIRFIQAPSTPYCFVEVTASKSATTNMTLTLLASQQTGKGKGYAEYPP